MKRTWYHKWVKSSRAEPYCGNEALDQWIQTWDDSKWSQADHPGRKDKITKLCYIKPFVFVTHFSNLFFFVKYLTLLPIQVPPFECTAHIQHCIRCIFSNRRMRSWRGVYVCVVFVWRGRESDLTPLSLLTTDQLTYSNTMPDIVSSATIKCLHFQSKITLQNNPGHDNWFIFFQNPTAVTTQIFVCSVNNYIFSCFDLVLFLKDLFMGEMTRSRVDRPGVRQLNAPCCSG